jgi:hypothetical protein
MNEGPGKLQRNEYDIRARGAEREQEQNNENKSEKRRTT